MFVGEGVPMRRMLLGCVSRTDTWGTQVTTSLATSPFVFSLALRHVAFGFPELCLVSPQFSRQLPPRSVQATECLSGE